MFGYKEVAVRTLHKSSRYSINANCLINWVKIPLNVQHYSTFIQISNLRLTRKPKLDAWEIIWYHEKVAASMLYQHYTLIVIAQLCEFLRYLHSSESTFGIWGFVHWKQCWGQECIFYWLLENHVFYRLQVQLEVCRLWSKIKVWLQEFFNFLL